MRNWLAFMVTLAVTTLSGVLPCLGAPPKTPVAAEPAPVVLLDSMGFWRMHHELRPPVIQMDGQLKPALILQSWMNHETAPVPSGWQSADFDDSAWFRGTALQSIQSPWLAHLSLRGKFQVTDPSLVKDLRLAADFHGGIIIYVNGQELCRRHLPAGPSSLLKNS